MPPDWVKAVCAVARVTRAWFSAEKAGPLAAPTDLEGRFQILAPPRTHQWGKLLLPCLIKPDPPS